ncbi:ABATE domain-containing protein [Bordetella sp. LUAb4]|uniref:CGNR zinc finger domain-containing protein n=1 Tax=Bordetella sp. LUAb4 TaxID=2843195 RepID=UPI001E4E2689|nr:ABATE domain-containing protein [Bordetella sp. LUAb4]
MAHTHPPAIFIADAMGLDFLNSIATPVNTPIDWIDTGAGLLAWMEQAGLVPAHEVAAIRKQALPGELDSVAAQARSLREWFRAYVRERMGRPLGRADVAGLEPLNTLLERDEGYSRVVSADSGEAGGEGDGLERRLLRRWRSPESLLLPIGAALADFVCDEDFTYVKACEGESCTLMFADHTRGHRRRWCSTAVCGNRAKVAAHRQRQKSKVAPSAIRPGRR